MSKKYIPIESANNRARICQRYDRTGKWRTETVNRDPDSGDMAVSTDERTNSTNLYVDVPAANGRDFETLQFDGRQAKSLFNLLSKHYRSL